MYVAVTRAERSLTLSWCRERSRARQQVPQEPSRFIAEMALSSGASGVRATVSNETARARLGALKDLLGASRQAK
jgi:ATP-dependent DNA helicase Rep